MPTLSIAVLALLVAVACTGDPPIPADDGLLGGRVLMAPGAGLAGAIVSVDQINLYDGKATVRVHQVGESRTDEQGFFEPIRTGSLAGLFLLRSSGGTYRDPISGAKIQLDPSVELRALHWLHDYYADRSTTAYITPVHSLVEARFRQAMDLPGNTDNLRVTRVLEESYARIGTHFGALNWELVIPGEVDRPAVSPTDEIRSDFVLGGLSVLADDLRGASDSTPQAVNLITLLRVAVQDLEQDGLFDGNDDNDRTTRSGLQIGTCPPVDPGCVTPPDGCQLGACRAACDLSAGSFRSALVGAIRKYVGPRAAPSVWNQTTLGSEDIRPMLEAMGSNKDPSLFGGACLETADRVPPSILWETPPDGAFLKGAITLRIRATDDAEAVPTVSFVGLTDTDQGASVAVAVLDTRLANGGTDGPIPVMAVARDAAGNERRDTRTFQADNTAPAVSVAPAGFHVESPSGTWWTGAGAPVLSGSLDELHPRAVEIVIAGEVVANATIEGSGAGATWSARLPAGKVTSGGNEVVVRAIDLAGNATTTVAVQLRLDVTPPGVLVESSLVHDERNSTVFYDLDNAATNTWLQRHVTGGAPIDLAQSMNGACATVHKFSHLLHESFVLGAIGNLNPLKTSFVVSDDGVGIEPGTHQARLTIRNGLTTTEVLPWTAIPGTGIGPKTTRHLLGLYRDGALAIPALATTEGEIHLELRARDKLGRTSLQERCWNHRILAPTLRPNGPAAGQRVMFPTSLQSSAGFSAAFLNANAAGDAMWIRHVRNYLGTPVYLQVSISQNVDAEVSRSFVIRNALANPRGVSFSCGVDPCFVVEATGIEVTPPPKPHNNLKLRARVFVMNGNQVGEEILPCPGCTNDDDVQSYTFQIPARATPQGAPLVEYAIVTHLRATLPAGTGTNVLMAPQNDDYPDSGPYGEFFFNGIQLTGRAEAPRLEVCTEQEEDQELGLWFCIERATRQTYRALTRVTYTLQNPLTTSYREGATSTLLTGALTDGVLNGDTIWSTTEPILP